MRKARYICAALMLSSLMITTGCSGEAEQKKTNDIVVEMPKDCKVDDIFQFESVSKKSLAGASSMGVSDGVYCVGALGDGNTVVWRYHDGSSMVYVKGEVSDTQIVYYAKRLQEDAVSYEEFKEEYEKEEK